MSQAAQTINRTDAADILDKMCHEIETAYLYPGKAQRITSRINAYIQKISPDSSLQIGFFEKSINTILLEESGDHHLKFYYDPKKFGVFQNKNQRTIDSLEKEKYRKINFGVQKVENLSGNIGLLRLNKFQQFDDVSVVLQGAMMMLAHSDAIIIDLRINGGGDGKTKEFLEIFFLNQEQFLNRYKVEFFDSTEFDSIKKLIPYSKNLETAPLYLVTGNGTFSAAEGFCYDLQQCNRARIIGTKTKGGGHSGSSVALEKGFLVFIPNDGKDSPIEGVGITPNIETKESMALAMAQKVILESLILTCSDTTALKQYKWNLESIEASLSPYNINIEEVLKYAGDYSHSIEVKLIGDELFLIQKKSKKKSRLLAINEKYFIAIDNLDFGYGNYRVEFTESGKAKLYINLGLKVAELEIFKADNTK